jgi:hypothetical protein
LSELAPTLLSLKTIIKGVSAVRRWWTPSWRFTLSAVMHQARCTMHDARCAKLYSTQSLLVILVSNFYMTDLEVQKVAACAYIHVHIGVRLSSLARLYMTSNEFANYYALMTLRSFRLLSSRSRPVRWMHRFSMCRVGSRHVDAPGYPRGSTCLFGFACTR